MSMGLCPGTQSEKLNQLTAAEDIDHYLWEKDSSYRNSSSSSSSLDCQVKEKT